MKMRVLFLCTGNSCRSQMAEAFLRKIDGDRFEALSAGAQPAGSVHPLAIQVMAEVGLDISGQRG
jgi:arsenate reductase